MKASSLSTIAQFLCCQTLPMNFARLVGDVGALLDSWLDAPFKTTWDSDSVVAFDQPGTRVLLAWHATPGLWPCGVLTLSVGPSLILGKPVMRPDAEALCQRLAAELHSRVQPDEVLWHQIACAMSEDWVELLIDALPHPGPDQPMVADQDAAMAEKSYDPPPPDPLRIAFRQDEPARLSPPMRLAIHAMNATLIMVWGPVGALALAHGLVKGENLRTAAQMMVLSGLASAVMHSPTGLALL